MARKRKELRTVERAKTVWGRFSRRLVVGLVVVLVAASLLELLHAVGIDFGPTTTVALWIAGTMVILSLLEPLVWMLGLLRGGKPTDDARAKHR